MFNDPFSDRHEQKTLIKYPSYIDTYSSLLDDIGERLAALELTHYASQLLEKGLHDEELEMAMHKAIKVLTAARFPSIRHFKKIFISQGGEIKKDWLVSELGIKLIMLNADVENPVVARLQIEILSHPDNL